MHKNRLGIKGEVFAAELLQKRGMRIVAANYTCRYGEIDIIAADNETICFVEVKTRKVNSMVSGAEAVTPQKQRKIITTALLYLQEHPCDLQPRFDVLAVTTARDGSILEYDYITGAFDSGEYYR